MGMLYLVATPIGNLEDISFRALKILKSAQLVAAEDTRQTQKLFQRFDITTPLISYHEHNKFRRGGALVDALANGDVALVSDAGTPGLNDPGYELVCEAISAGYQVSAVPGPSAPMMALVISGLPTDEFLYLGYLPRKQRERREKLEEISGFSYTLIFLEAPHRIREALDDMYSILGGRQMAVARELTKVHEQIFRGSIREAVEYFRDNEPRGEFTLVIHGKENSPEGPWSEERIVQALEKGMDGTTPLATLAAQVAKLSGWSRRDVYRLAVMSKEKELMDRGGEYGS